MVPWAVLLAGALAACGGSGGGSSSPTTYSISGTVSGANGVKVSLTGQATGSTTANGSYSFNGLANGSYTVTPTLAGYGFTPGSLQVTVNGADVTGQNFVATATSFTVSGVAVDKYGTPLAGVPVALPLTSAAVTTGADGTFTFANVTPPYDIAMLIQDSSGDNVYVFHGVTTLAPRVPAVYTGPAPSQAAVDQTVDGAADAYYYAVFGSPETGNDFEDSAPLPSPWTVTVPWAGPSPLAGTLYVLAGAGSDPETYSAYGKVPALSLADGGDTPASVTLASVDAPQTLQVSATAPPGYALATDGSSYVSLVFGEADWLTSLAYLTAPSTTVSIPSIAEGTIRVDPLAYPSLTNNGEFSFVCQDFPASVTSDQSLALNLLSPPIYVSPVDMATNWDPVGAGFSWNAPAQASGSILYEVDAFLGFTLNVYSFGTATSFKVPPLSVFGVPGVALPGQAASVWYVQAISSTAIATPDDLLGATSSHTLFNSCNPLQAVAQGAILSFTTP